MKTFQEFLSDDISTLPTLTLAHTTNGRKFREIIKQKEIKLSPCDVLNEDLLFTYYGKPEYRNKSYQNVHETSQPLVTFILNANVFKKYYKVFPFDTGAFFKIPKLKDLFFNEDTKIEEFELIGSIDSAKKIIKTFYDSNENYIELETILKNPFNKLDFEVDGYIKLINDRSNFNWDNRVRTIEIIHNNVIKLNDKVVKQIILPSIYYEDDDVKRIINIDFNIPNPMTYRLSGGDANQYWSEINNLYKSI